MAERHQRGAAPPGFPTVAHAVAPAPALAWPVSCRNRGAEGGPPWPPLSFRRRLSRWPAATVRFAEARAGARPRTNTIQRFLLALAAALPLFAKFFAMLSPIFRRSRAVSQVFGCVWTRWNAFK